MALSTDGIWILESFAFCQLATHVLLLFHVVYLNCAVTVDSKGCEGKVAYYVPGAL